MSKLDEELQALLDKRDALLRNPTLEAATVYWNENRFPTPARIDVPLAAVHKARLQWLDATDAMLAESIAWLTSHDYDATLKGAPPLTPERRDADRISMGKPPLNPEKKL